VSDLGFGDLRRVVRLEKAQLLLVRGRGLTPSPATNAQMEETSPPELRQRVRDVRHRRRCGGQQVVE